MYKEITFLSIRSSFKEFSVTYDKTQYEVLRSDEDLVLSYPLQRAERKLLMKDIAKGIEENFEAVVRPTTPKAISNEASDDIAVDLVLLEILLERGFKLPKGYSLEVEEINLAA